MDVKTLVALQPTGRYHLLHRGDPHHLCAGAARHGRVLRPDLRQPPREARVPHLPQHRGLPPRHVPGPAALLRGPGPGKGTRQKKKCGKFHITVLKLFKMHF